MILDQHARGKRVQFRLSPEGKAALGGLFPKDSIEGFVEEVDDLGAWILLKKLELGRRSTLMLLKWDYFATAVVEIEPEMPVEKVEMGFRP